MVDTHRWRGAHAGDCDAIVTPMTPRFTTLDLGEIAFSPTAALWEGGKHAGTNTSMFVVKTPPGGCLRGPPGDPARVREHRRRAAPRGLRARVGHARPILHGGRAGLTTRRWSRARSERGAASHGRPEC